jgi:hypothetical protein
VHLVAPELHLPEARSGTPIAQVRSPKQTWPTKRSDLDGAAIPILSITWRSFLQRRR